MSPKKISFTLCYAVSGLVTALILSWIILAQCDFFYGFWHDHVGIAEGIEEYGPQNRYRQGFADTSRDERVRLFAAINRAVHHDGEGLADIRYKSASMAQPQTLLRVPEMVHLKDVAELLNKLKWAGLLVTLVWLGCCVRLLYGRRPLPKLKHQLLGIGSIFLITGALVALVGPVSVFNQFHIWIFPAGHAWFFYYQDSLMSTMMLAPRLFGWILLAWLPMAILCFLTLHAGVVVVGKSLKPQATSRKKKTVT